MTRCRRTVDLETAVIAAGGGGACVNRTLPPSLKLALRNLAAEGASAEDVACEAHEVRVPTRPLNQLAKLGFVEKKIERTRTARGTTTKRIFWLTPSGATYARGMDA